VLTKQAGNLVQELGVLLWFFGQARFPVYIRVGCGETRLFSDFVQTKTWQIDRSQPEICAPYGILAKQLRFIKLKRNFITN
jgi:hypothetical protein